MRADEIIRSALGAGLTVVWKRNRRRLLSVSKDRRRLFVNRMFEHAPAEVLRAIAAEGRAMARGTAPDRPRRELILAWTRGPGATIRVQHGGILSGGRGHRRCAGSDRQRAFMRELYRRLAVERFDDALPHEIPVILSRRMTRRLGDCVYRQEGGREIAEIGVNIDLLLAGNEPYLVETMLHEMAHGYAWLHHGSRGHDRVWKAVAVTAGCRPERLCAHRGIRQRPRGMAPTARVPDLDALATARPR